MLLQRWTKMSIISSLLNCSTAERIKAFDLLINHPDTAPLFESKVSAIVEKVLLTSELNIVKRISKLETITGLQDFSDFEDEEEHELTIPEQLATIKENINHIQSQPPEKSIVAMNPDTKTGIRATHLIAKLKASGKDHLTHREIKSILSDEELPEDCRITERCKNPRKTIIDVLNTAVSICSDVFLDQKKKGHREWRIALRS